MVKARSAALRALAIDKNLPEAHTALALIVQNYDHDWQTAGNEYRRAIELNPSYATAHHWYAEHLGYLARFEEAFQENERARQLDPLSLIIAVDNGVLLIYSRQYDRAIEKCRSVLDLDKNFNMAEGCVARAYRLKRMFPEALRVYETASNDFAEPLWKWSELAYIYGRAGQQQQAWRALDKVKQLYRPQQTDPSVFVTAYLGLGDVDQTFAWLEKAYAQHSNAMSTLKVDPLYDLLRGDPRYQGLLRRVGLAE
jgi:tetratricopeptide (TPR) repeat protein